MALKRTLFGGWAALVGASECVNSTVQSFLGDGDVKDMALDSKGTVWFVESNRVMMCPVDGECASIEGDWASPSGIVVHDAYGRTFVYISEDGRPGFGSVQAISPGVKRCTLNGQRLDDCIQFGGSWDVPHGLAWVTWDLGGNVLVTNYEPDRNSHPLNKSNGVWNCSPFGDCVELVKGNETTNVAADSKGNVFVTGVLGTDQHRAAYLEKCTSSFGHDVTCADFDPPPLRQFNRGFAFAIGPDDYVYTMAGGTLMRCSPENSCENLGDFYGMGTGQMAMDKHGIIYTVSLNSCNPPGPCLQLELRKISCDISTDILQV